MQDGYLNLRARGKLSENGLYFTHAIQKLYSLKASVIFFILSGNLLLREGPFHTVNCLQSFVFKLFFTYTLDLLKVPFWHICTEILF